MNNSQLADFANLLSLYSNIFPLGISVTLSRGILTIHASFKANDTTKSFSCSFPIEELCRYPDQDPFFHILEQLRKSYAVATDSTPSLSPIRL